MTTKMTRLVLVAMLVTSAWTATLGTAMAHECESHNRAACNPDKCTEGENHKHTHLKYWWEPGENESCRSTKSGDDPDPPECKVLGVKMPDIVCDGPFPSAPVPPEMTLV